MLRYIQEIDESTAKYNHFLLRAETIVTEEEIRNGNQWDEQYPSKAK